jgi:hypothetical protein
MVTNFAIVTCGSCVDTKLSLRLWDVYELGKRALDKI